jgi:hypothetical protein
LGNVIVTSIVSTAISAIVFTFFVLCHQILLHFFKGYLIAYRAIIRGNSIDKNSTYVSYRNAPNPMIFFASLALVVVLDTG